MVMVSPGITLVSVMEMEGLPAILPSTVNCLVSDHSDHSILVSRYLILT